MMNERWRLALQDIACAFGCWVIAFVVAMMPLVLTVWLIHVAVRRWG